MLHTHEIQQEKALEFITAGKAIFTIRSIKTGNRFTYKIACPNDNSKENANVLWVSLLQGCNNESDYGYMCYIKGMKYGKPELCVGAKSRITKDASAFIAFKFVFENLVAKRLMNSLEIWHEGKCCRCGRKLTVPESIISGIGPECASIKEKHNHHTQLQYN